MIISSLSYMSHYYATHPLFSEALRYAITNMYSLKEGKYSVLNDDIYLIISENELRSREEAPLEAHNKYIDIQIVISGTEIYGICDRQRCCLSKGGYDEERDIEFFEDEFENEVTLKEGDCAVFFPEDAHAPLIGRGRVRKAILKIKR